MSRQEGTASRELRQDRRAPSERERDQVVRLRVAIVVAGLVLGAALMLSAGTSAAPDGEEPRQ